MELKQLYMKDDALISRKEYIFQVEFDKATPSRFEIRDRISKAVSAEPDMLVVRRIDVNFGERKALVLAYVYSDKKIMKQLERQSMLEKNGLAEKPAEKPETKEPEAPKKAEA